MLKSNKYGYYRFDVLKTFKCPVCGLEITIIERAGKKTVLVPCTHCKKPLTDNHIIMVR